MGENPEVVRTAVLLRPQFSIKPTVYSQKQQDSEIWSGWVLLLLSWHWVSCSSGCPQTHHVAETRPWILSTTCTLLPSNSAFSMQYSPAPKWFGSLKVWFPYKFPSPKITKQKVGDTDKPMTTVPWERSHWIAKFPKNSIWPHK